MSVPLNLEAWTPYEVQVAAAAALTNAAISPAVDAKSRFEVADLYVTVDSATTATGGVAVRIGFGATALPAGAATPVAGIVLSHAGIAAGSGLFGIPGKGAAGEELRATTEDPVGGSIRINYLGRIVPA